VRSCHDQGIPEASRDGKTTEVLGLLTDLRSLALRQPGYVLVRH